MSYNNRGVKLKGWRFAAFVGALFGSISAYLYPIVVAPMRNPDEWKQMSEDNRRAKGIKQENIQPGNMKVWSDPFDRPGKPGNKDAE